jgi:tetratricopeptide (TPR) repeat protein
MRVRPHALFAIAPVLFLGIGSVALTPAAAETGDAAVPVETRSWLGNYLAGRFAAKQYDVPAAAAFYRRAMEKDPGNAGLIDQAFQMEASRGNWARAEPLAKELAKLQPGNRLAQAFLGLVAFKAGRYAEAEEHFTGGAAHPIGELTNAVARAWIIQAQKRSEDALGALDAPKLPDWTNTFVRYHRALLADVAGRTTDARASYGRIAKGDQRILRVALAFASHAANAGDMKLAQGILNAHFERSKSEGHPHALALLQQIEAGRRPQLLVGSSSEGMAELFYGLGEMLAGESGGLGVGILFLQFSLYLNPEATFPLLALAGTQEAVKHNAAAIAAYDRVPKGTPLEAAIAIKKALNLNQLDKVDEARTLLDEFARQHPRDIRPLEALGNIMRAHKRYAEAIDYYTRAIALIGKPEVKHWTYFSARGSCYERLKKLPQAEADLQRSLQLSPDQPYTLNYLGYTWIDHNRNLRKGLALIEKAVRLKPDDGDIVDSLGWAHYRLGNFQEAVRHLERAVELRPDESTLNDHLGDAYWRVGREREARYQWDQALKLKPEPPDADKIREKLEKGLPAVQTGQAKRRSRQVRRQERAKRPSEVNAAPASE